MRRRQILSMALTAALAVAGGTPPPGHADWWAVNAPSQGLSRVHGGYTAGCVAGAASLPLSGPGFQVMRPSRNRYYGHPDAIRFVTELGRAVERAGAGPILIGDLSQPRGGPMAYGHRSHQTGLDIDIWFRRGSRGGRPFPDEIENLPMRSVVDAAAGRLHRQHWEPRLATVLELAAESPRVERIFVNPVIKRALCRTKPASDQAWLHKLRPWWGHDAHFHVRLACPDDSPNCRPQSPQPRGDGCGEGLDDWVRDLAAKAKTVETDVTRKTPASPNPMPPSMPLACRALVKLPG